MFFKIDGTFKISQISQENTCVGISFLIKLQALKLQTSLKTVKDNGDNVTEENGEWWVI